jgi:PadR family transcriptional regulator PadR
VESSGGPPRKYFSLTEKGADFYKELDNTWREMSEAVERVILVPPVAEKSKEIKEPEVNVEEKSEESKEIIEEPNEKTEE